MAKAGVKTSELWLTAVQTGVGLLISFLAGQGLLVQEDIDTAAVNAAIAETYSEATDGDDDIRSLVQGGVALAGLFAAGLAVGGYNKSRTAVKVAEATGGEADDTEEA